MSHVSSNDYSKRKFESNVSCGSLSVGVTLLCSQLCKMAEQRCPHMYSIMLKPVGLYITWVGMEKNKIIEITLLSYVCHSQPVPTRSTEDSAA